MGLYPIDCSSCKRPFQWFSGNGADQRCARCRLSDSFSLVGDLNLSDLDAIDTAFPEGSHDSALVRKLTAQLRREIAQTA